MKTSKNISKRISDVEVAATHFKRGNTQSLKDMRWAFNNPTPKHYGQNKGEWAEMLGWIAEKAKIIGKSDCSPEVQILSEMCLRIAKSVADLAIMTEDRIEKGAVPEIDDDPPPELQTPSDKKRPKRK